MPYFTVMCSERLHFEVEVEAETADEAEEKVWEQCNPYDLPNWVTDATDFDTSGVEIKKEK